MKKNKSMAPSAKKATPAPLKLPVKRDKKNHTSVLLALFTIIVLGIIIYSNSFDCSFHLDDTNNIINNTAIRDLSDFNAMWNSGHTRFVSIYSFALNYHFDELNVWGYHLVNLVIHLFNASLVYWLTLLIFSCPTLDKNPLTGRKNEIAFFTALLFVAHPLATQSVTYIVQRMASLAALFYLFSVALYLKGRLTRHGKVPKYLFFTGSLVSAVLAMLSKENAFTLPFAILLSELFFFSAKKPFFNFKDQRFVLFLALIITTAIIVFTIFPMNIFDPVPSLSNGYTVTPANYLYTQFGVIVKYIQLLLLPVNQNLDHDFPLSNSLFETRTILSLLLISAILTSAIFLFKKYPILSFGICWFFLTLSIESSFIPIKDLIFEHRTYLPSFGFFLALVSLVYGLLENKKRYLAIIVLSVIAGSFAFVAHERNNVWKDELTLWTDVVSKSPGKARPYVNRGLAYYNLGERNKALADDSMAISINPKYALAHYDRATLYMDYRLWDKAVTDYSEAIRYRPDYPDAYYGRGLAYTRWGKPEMAISDFSRVIVMNPNYINAYNNRGNTYSTLGLWDKALADYSKAILMAPNHAKAYYNRGIIYGKLEQWDKAISDYGKATEIDPGYADAYYNCGNAYFNTRQWDKAIASYSKAISIDPKYTNAISNRDAAYKESAKSKK